MSLPGTAYHVAQLRPFKTFPKREARPANDLIGIFLQDGPDTEIVETVNFVDVVPDVLALLLKFRGQAIIVECHAGRTVDAKEFIRILGDCLSDAAALCLQDFPGQAQIAAVNFVHIVCIQFARLFASIEGGCQILISIFFMQYGEKITPYMLSSGEKQMLVILLTALVQDGRPGALFMDEPEISLHIEWQQRLITLIRTLNPNVQIILCTHSPAIIMDGWVDAVTEIADITQ